MASTPNSPDRLPFSPYNAFVDDTFRSFAARRLDRVVESSDFTLEQRMAICNI